jgi:hypothetical protein
MVCKAKDRASILPARGAVHGVTKHAFCGLRAPVCFGRRRGRRTSFAIAHEDIAVDTEDPFIPLPVPAPVLERSGMGT